jgi:hypothetical protein
MLTKVLAARLPATDFLPVYVELRDVPAEADIQDQIEQAIRQTTGDRVEWTDLARSAGDAIPVILLDGFDELLQATGAQHVDYLTKVSQFQKREADQGRQLAVIVTTRIAVAGLARFPEESTALRLEPFDESQVEQWIAIWNDENRSYFVHGGAQPLKPESVLAYPELATQPLLLLMLALYDADKNALQGTEGVISRGDLYERLLVQFARREVVKANRGHTDEELDRDVEGELRRLSYVAFAMFNRGAQWVSQDELNRDLVALLGENAGSSKGSLRGQLNEAEIAIGRFFFIHRARARQAAKRVETYEFLHATFSEYLVARMVWMVVRHLVAREMAADDFFDRISLDDDTLYTLLSFAPLTSRAPIVRFLAEMSARLSETERHVIGGVLIRVFRTVHDRRADRGRENYEPRPTPMPRRHANYSANLVILAAAVLGEVRASQLYGREEGVIGLWQADTLLWRSQIDYYSIMGMVSLRRTWNGKNRDMVLALVYDGNWSISPVELKWSYPTELSPGWDKLFLQTYHTDYALMRRQQYFGSAGDDVIAHAIEPLVDYLPNAMTTFATFGEQGFRSVGHMMLRILLHPLVGDIEQPEWVYLWCAEIVDAMQMDRSDLSAQFAELIVSRMCVDSHISPPMAARVLKLLGAENFTPSVVLACVVRFLGQDRDADLALLRIADRLRSRIRQSVDRVEFEVELELRIAELGIDTEWKRWDQSGWRRRLRELAHSRRRPDLVRRGEWMLSHLYGPEGERPGG